jgi:DNA-binding transcriptional regulator YiaG
MTSETLRHLRGELGWTQQALACHLAVSPETYRCWESGRRAIPPEIVTRLWSVSAAERDDEPLTLSALAPVLGVHVRTLRAAARDGRLAVGFGTRTYFGRPVPLATAAAGRAFVHLYYRKTTRWTPRPLRPQPLPRVPPNYDLHVIGLRVRLRMTQEQFARAIGVAGKAVIYQWESRRRRPSAALWRRVQQLGTA